MKNLVEKILICFILISVSSCTQRSVGLNDEDVNKLENKMVYFKDKKTGLCFGAINSSSYGGDKITSITCVPCDSVKKFIK